MNISNLGLKTLSVIKSCLQSHSLQRTFLLAAALLFISPVERLYADGGDFSLNLKAADSSTYDHTAGGGAWNDGGQGNTSESLDTAKDDFICGNTVSYLIEIVVDDGALDTQSIDINMDFGKETTGQPGVSFESISNVEINYNPDLLSGATIDTAIDDDGGSSVTWNVVDDGTNLNLAITVDDLEAMETVIVRIDAVISCVHNSSPTGNLQAGIDSANITGDVNDQINFGQETISLKINKIVTPILVSRFDAYSNGSAGWIKWSTAWEVGALAYQVERQANPADPNSEWLRIHSEEWLPFSILGSHTSYTLADNSLIAGDLARYRIIEKTEAEQAEEPLIYGPFDVVVAKVNRPQPKSGVSQPGRSGKPKSADKQSRSQSSLSQAQRNTLNSHLTAGASVISATPMVKVAVTRQGIQRISTAALAAQFGVTEKQAAQWLKQGQFALTSDDGQPVAWKKHQDDLLFYGEAIPENHWNTARYYWLAADSAGQIMQKEALPNSSGSVLTNYRAESSYDATTHGAVWHQPIYWPMGVKEDPYSFMAFAWNGDGDPLPEFYDTLSIPTDQSAVDIPATLTVSGNLEDRGSPGEDTVVSIIINGEVIDELTFITPIKKIFTSNNYDFPFTMPGHFLRETDLEVTVSVESPRERFWLYIDAIELQYRREFVATAAAAIEFSSDNAGIAKVTGFPEAEQLIALKVTNSLQPVWLNIGKDSGEIEAFFQTDKYVIASESGWQVPDLSLQEPAPIVSSDTDYLIVSAQSLLAGAAELANYRADLVSSIVSIESIYDHVSDGNPNPEALRIFLKSLSQKPRYVVLLGSGSLDYKDFFGYGGNLVSPMLMNIDHLQDHGLTLNVWYDDSQFVDFDGDFRPDLSIGRIPASNMEELSRYIDKLRAFESSDFQQQPDLIVTDNNVTFTAQGEILANNIKGDSVSLHASELGTTETKAQLLTQLEMGVSSISYFGHSGEGGLASRTRILSGADAQTVTNTRLPILVGLGCSINSFVYEWNYESGALVHSFMLDNDYGFIASFASSNVSETGEALKMGVTFHAELETAERLGDAVLPAISNHDFVQFGYGLLGDPALKLR